MSDKYAALKQAAERAIAEEGDIWWDQEQLTRYPDTMKIHEAEADFIEAASPATTLELLAERDADKRRIAELTAERDALREGEMGDAKHSNTRAAADIYFQLVEECEIPAGGSLIEYIDEMRQRVAELEARTLTVKLPSLNPKMFNDDVMFGYRKAQREAVESCAAAGISLKIEGE